MNIGINGSGRIGKCVFLQCLEDETINIKAININNLNINDLQRYINYDSVHHLKKYHIKILENNYIQIENNENNEKNKTKKIKIFNEKNPEKINWKKENVNYLFETTGIFLTREKLEKHKVNKIILSAPPKDDTSIYCYGVNERNYNGEKIISGASCTTNCIAPFLNLLNMEIQKNKENQNEILLCNFITIHSATASQKIADKADMEKRTYRSLFNIIPYKTGASKCIDKLIPELKNKVFGTCVRVPTQNVSMIDLNIVFKNPININDLIIDILNHLIYNEALKEVIQICYDKLVSSDYIGEKAPCIIDYHACKQLTDNSIKFTLWYDNEWSYSAQIIRLLKSNIKI